MSTHEVLISGQRYFIVRTATGMDYSVFKALTFSDFGNDRLIRNTRTKWIGSASDMLGAVRVILGLHPNA